MGGVARLALARVPARGRREFRLVRDPRGSVVSAGWVIGAVAAGVAYVARRVVWSVLRGLFGGR